MWSTMYNIRSDKRSVVEKLRDINKEIKIVVCSIVPGGLTFDEMLGKESDIEKTSMFQTDKSENIDA
ncbi:hypothetical protein WA026_012168 [Henosepilachna vigintioctopunctata]|uniref:Uncharacterized protein n=1 Tax=Henosepilachna vigintioctopunctata TaxID=420089 RepID=A0AAW1VFK5_9CUCU